jgi:PAS domain S-box-containing protein
MSATSRRSAARGAAVASENLDQINERLRREIAAHEATLRELDGVRHELELRVSDRTKELSLVKARFETALRGAKVYVFSQDRDLRYTWVYTPEGGETGTGMLGRTDEELLPPAERAAVIDLKQRVLRTGRPDDCEVAYLLPGGRVLASLHVEPSYAPDGTIDGLICAAINISHVRLLESEQQRLSRELATTLQRYETALRGSNVTVFTQDRDLRYTSISNSFLARDIEGIVGRTDDDILPGASLQPVLALKRDALEQGDPRDGEVRITDAGTDRWFDLHIEPLRDLGGEIVGLTGTAVDVTERRESEAHLRLLLREITHRSKNLLAVIQAMARQTARHTESTDAFLERFSARLQALATSHDLLVQESWHGASLEDLARLQLGHYLEREQPQLVFAGPAVLLKPEAAQALGLALHELATNAAKYGALSTPSGHVSVAWERLPAAEGYGIALTWRETGGPKVAVPSRRGFGSLVIERHLARSLDGEVTLDFTPEGVECRVVIPVTQFVAVR